MILPILWEKGAVLMAEDQDEPTGNKGTVTSSVVRAPYGDLPPDLEVRIFTALQQRRDQTLEAISRAKRGETLTREHYDDSPALGELRTREDYDAPRRIVRIPTTSDYVYGLAASDNAVAGTAASERINTALLENIDVLRELARLLLEKERAGTPARTALPRALPQQVFQEMRAVNQAIADGPSGRRWSEIEGETAMRHVVPEQPHQTKFAPGSALIEWWGAPPRLETLRAELSNAGLPAVLLASVAVGLALQHNQVCVGVDELGRYIGLDPRSREERLELRQRVWRWLMLLDSLPVIGKRPGRYRDPRTKREIELTSVDAFIRITGKRLPVQPALDGNEPPVEVNFVAGPWINLYRGNRQILSDFDDVLKIAAIPAGKPSGAWAQSIGLALNQRWRERAHGAHIGRAGEENRVTVQVGRFTREGLLDLFRAEPYFRDVLQGKPESRADLLARGDRAAQAAGCDWPLPRDRGIA